MGDRGAIAQAPMKSDVGGSTAGTKRLLLHKRSRINEEEEAKKTPNIILLFYQIEP